jgi:hypothetical protein
MFSTEKMNTGLRNSLLLASQIKIIRPIRKDIYNFFTHPGTESRYLRDPENIAHGSFLNASNNRPDIMGPIFGSPLRTKSASFLDFIKLI